MLTNRAREQIKPKLTRMQLIHGVFTAAPLIYTFVAHQANSSRTAPTTEVPPLLLVILIVMAVVGFGGGFVWQKIFFGDKRLSTDFAKPPESAPIDVNSLDEAGRLALFADYVQRMYIVSWAFAESVAIYGFVLTMMQGRIETMLPFVGVSVIALAVLRPQAEEIIDRGMRRIMMYGTPQ